MLATFHYITGGFDSANADMTPALTCGQDFRTGYYTLASPKALFTVQILGAFLGVLFSPAVYTFYNHAFKIGVDYLYSAPYAGIYRGMGIVAANGVSTLPHNCLLIACLMALGAVLMNLIRVRLCFSEFTHAHNLRPGVIGSDLAQACSGFLQIDMQRNTVTCDHRNAVTMKKPPVPPTILGTNS